MWAPIQRSGHKVVRNSFDVFLFFFTLAGLSFGSRHEAHVTFTAEASLQVQTVAILTQVAVLRTLVAVCRGQTYIITVRKHAVCKCIFFVQKQNAWFKDSDLSSRIHLQRIRPCTRSGRSPWCWDSRRCCCTCGSHLSTHPGLKQQNPITRTHVGTISPKYLSYFFTSKNKS